MQLAGWPRLALLAPGARAPAGRMGPMPADLSARSGFLVAVAGLPWPWVANRRSSRLALTHRFRKPAFSASRFSPRRSPFSCLPGAYGSTAVFRKG